MEVPSETEPSSTRKPYKVSQEVLIPISALNQISHQIKDVSRTVKKAMMASSLEEMRQKARDKFEKEELPKMLLDLDGTEIDEDEYFQTLEAGTELVAVFPGEQWADVSAGSVLVTVIPSFRKS